MTILWLALSLLLIEDSTPSRTYYDYGTVLFLISYVRHKIKEDISTVMNEKKILIGARWI